MSCVTTARIYYSCNNYPNTYMDVPCTRWDEDDWAMTFEFFCEGSSQRNALFDNLTPGATRELYNILGTPTHIDTTYTSGNSLIIEPLSGHGVSGVRERRTVAVKSISDEIFGTKYFTVKLDCVRLDTS